MAWNAESSFGSAALSRRIGTVARRKARWDNIETASTVGADIEPIGVTIDLGATALQGWTDETIAAALIFAATLLLPASETRLQGS